MSVPAGEFGAWLDGMQAALRGEADSDVPCGSCTACCRSGATVAAGVAVWVLFFPQVGGQALSELFPGQLAGLLAAFVGMVAGSLAPQALRNRHEAVHHVEGLQAR